jgi:ATP synthase protein I
VPETSPTTPDFPVTSRSVRSTLTLWVSVTAGIVTAAAATYYGVHQGAHAAVGAVVGGVLVAVFFVSGVGLATLSTKPEQPEGMVLIYALAGYTAQVVGLFLVMVVFRHTSLFDHQAFGVTILVTTVVSLVAAIVGFVRAKIPTIVPAVVPAEAPDNTPDRPVAPAQDRL